MWQKDITTAGWTCGVCGMFVGHGLSHYCAGSIPFGPATTLPFGGGGDTVEIIDLLKRIVELLEESQGIIRLNEQG